MFAHSFIHLSGGMGSRLKKEWFLVVLAVWGLTLKNCLTNSLGTFVIYTEHVSCRTPSPGCLFIKLHTCNVSTIFLLIPVAQNWRHFDATKFIEICRSQACMHVSYGRVCISISGWAQEDEHERDYGLDKKDPC